MTLDGERPSRVDEAIPIIMFMLEGVAPGAHAIEIKDVVGFSETAAVTVEAPPSVDPLLPIWLAEWVEDLESGNAEFRPQSITRHQRRGETVYYVVHQSCERFSDLLDADGNLIGHPDGGITGRGDGVTLFFPTEGEGDEVWSVR